MHRRFYYIVTIICMGALSACTYTQSLSTADLSTSELSSSKLNSGEVSYSDFKIYFTKRPDRPYDETGYVITTCYNLNKGAIDFINKAKQTGADAVIGTQIYVTRDTYVISGVAVKLK